MSKVFTTNIFLTSSRKVIDKIFSSRTLSTNFSSLSKNLTPSENKISVICSPSKNNNLIEMSYEFGTNEGNNGLLSLTFLESDSLFEKVYILSRPEDYQLSLNVSGQNQEPRRDVPYVYITFGIGNDLNDWAGPFQMQLQNANYEIDRSGNRIITLKYLPVLGPIIRNLIHKRYNRYDYDKIDTGSDQVHKYIITKSTTTSTSILNNQKKFNKLYRSLITSYLKAITNDMEILVLLPDMNDSVTKFKTLIKQKKFKEFFASIGLSSEPVRNEIARSILAIPEIMHDIKKIPPEIASLYTVYISNAKGLLPKNPNENDQSLYDSYLPLREIGERLTELFTEDPANTNTKGFELRFSVEHNVKLINLLYKHKFITTDTKNVFIWGDSRLIDSLIYLKDIITYDQITNVDLKGVKLTDEDTLKFVNLKYRKEFVEKMFPKASMSSSFNEKVDIGVSVENEEDSLSVDLRTGSLIPIFRHGIVNPNVIALNMEKNLDLITIYNGQGFKDEERVAYVNNKKQIDSAKELSADILKLNFGQITDRLQKLYKDDKDTFDKSNITSDVTSKISSYLDTESFIEDTGVTVDYINKKLKSKGQPLNKEKISQATAKATLVKLQNGLNDNINSYIKIKSAQQAEILEKSIFDRLKESVILIGLKTLPFFDIVQLGRLCYLLAGDNNLIGTRKVDYSSFLNGRYRVLSFKHYISRSETYSEFTIIPDKNQALNDATFIDPNDPTKVISAKDLFSKSLNNIPNNPKRDNPQP